MKQTTSPAQASGYDALGHTLRQAVVLILLMFVGIGIAAAQPAQAAPAVSDQTTVNLTADQVQDMLLDAAAEKVARDYPQAVTRCVYDYRVMTDHRTPSTAVFVYCYRIAMPDGNTVDEVGKIKIPLYLAQPILLAAL